MNKPISLFRQGIRDTWKIFTQELGRIFSDTGIVLIFFFAGLLYPILYNLIYSHEFVYDLPIAVVDECNSNESREYTRNVNATRELNVAYKCINLEEAKKLWERKKIHGIIYFPSDYQARLNENKQAFISIYCDMSSFLYYKNMYQATHMVLLNKMNDIQIKRYESIGMGTEQAQQIVKAIPYEDIYFYQPGGGFASFLMPIILILILHQTMFFGIGMLAGTSREEEKDASLIPEHLHSRGIYRVVFGRAMAYFLIYLGLTAYGIVLIPRIFNLPHLEDFWELMWFMIPFIIATIFFSITVSIFVRKRENGIVLGLFFTVILLFLSGISWPASNISPFWRTFSYLFPSTFGIQGYISMSTMGSHLPMVHKQFTGLWIQSGVYFLTACVTMIITVRSEQRKRDKATNVA